MPDSNPDSNPGVSVPAKRGGWRRFFLWSALTGAVLVVSFLILLTVLTVPNLRREVAPPEVSGTHRIGRTAPESPSVLPPASSESATSPSQVSAKTPSLFNLDDFPHLSPTMRTLSQAWLDQCEETSRALDSIPNPELRDRMLQFLRIRKDKMRAFLNAPLKWEDQTFKDAESRIWRGRSIYGVGGRSPEELDATLRKEANRFDVLSKRMSFEYYASRKMWDLAADACGWADREASYQHEFLKAWRRGRELPADPESRAGYREVNTWDEEVYCLRQMGGRGLVALTARSYQQAVGARMKGQENSTLFQVVRLGTAPLLIPTVLNPASQKRAQERHQTPATGKILEDGTQK
jgi:hypothetical protein